MPTRDLTVVCTLQPGELNVVGATTAQYAIENGFRFEFQPNGEVLAAIIRMIDAERQCCPFLRFQLTVEAGCGPVVLDLTGPPGSQEFLGAVIQSA